MPGFASPGQRRTTSPLLTPPAAAPPHRQYLLARMGEVCAPGALPPARETALRGGAFNSAVRELLSYYISLEEYYMEESLTKVGNAWGSTWLGVWAACPGACPTQPCRCAASPKLLTCFHHPPIRPPELPGHPHRRGCARLPHLLHGG